VIPTKAQGIYYGFVKKDPYLVLRLVLSLHLLVEGIDVLSLATLDGGIGGGGAAAF
jgi:hypothetical protein